MQLCCLCCVSVRKMLHCNIISKWLLPCSKKHLHLECCCHLLWLRSKVDMFSQKSQNLIFTYILAIYLQSMVVMIGASPVFFFEIRPMLFIYKICQVGKLFIKTCFFFKTCWLHFVVTKNPQGIQPKHWQVIFDPCLLGQGQGRIWSSTVLQWIIPEPSSHDLPT